MLTNACYTVLAALLAGRMEPPALTIAVGAGDPSWDHARPDDDRSRDRLHDEVDRARVRPDGLTFLAPDGRPTDRPTAVIQATVRFGEDEATGTLRECGLFARVGQRDHLLAHYVHPRIEKGPRDVLERRIRIDLTPRAVAPGSRVTRWLGNTRTQEIHDTERENANCQLAEIAADRRFYFATEEDARERGYDPCAYCLGREASER